MGDPKKMSLMCGDDEPCALNTGSSSEPIEVRIGLWRTGLPLTAETLQRIDAYLVNPDTGARLTPSAKTLTTTGVVVTFLSVAQRRYLFNATEKDDQGKVAYEVVDEPLQVDASQVDRTGAQAMNLELAPHARVTLRVRVEIVSMGADPSDPSAIKEIRRRPEPDATVTLVPQEHTRLVAAEQGVFTFEVMTAEIYQILVKGPDGLRAKATAWTGAAVNEMTLELVPRYLIYYVTIDHVELSPDMDHNQNISGLRDAAASYTASFPDQARAPTLAVQRTWYARLPGLDLSNVLALFFSGSYDEWASPASQSDDSKRWREQTKTFVRDTRVPILAVCGSHQLMGYLWNELNQAGSGWSSIGHIGGMTIQQELDERQKRISRGEQVTENLLPGATPQPRAHQVGDFKHTLVTDSPKDPIFTARKAISSFVFYDTHADEIVKVPPQFTLLVRDDGNNWRAGEPNTNVQHRSLNQGMRYRSSSRLLYSFQFHPEFFASAQRPIEGPKYFTGKTNDGDALLHNFLEQAREFWRKNP